MKKKVYGKQSPSQLDHFWQYREEKVLKALHTTANGLSHREALRRLKNRAQRSVTRPKWLTVAQLFISQFTSPLVLLLVFSALLSFALDDWENALILMAILTLTGIVSFWQEYRADNAVQRLRAMMRINCTVMRDGTPQKIWKEAIVPGDVVVLSAGDVVPGDCLLTEAQDLHTNESALTGESFPVEKSTGIVDAAKPIHLRKNTVFEGTSIINGFGRAVVVHCGTDTEFGQISARMGQAAPETAFQTGIREFGVLLLRLTFLFSGALLIFNLFLGKPVTSSILFSIALAVGLAPELLPAIIGVALANGARRMAKDKVIVKKLEAIQNLGAVQILCSDKTGTLTTGAATIAKVLDSEGQSSDRVKLFAYLNATFETGFANPIDDAIRQLQDIDISHFSKKDEVPYDFERKRLSIVAQDGTRDLMITKGAVSNILDICTQVERSDGKVEHLSTLAYHDVWSQYQSCSAQGYRTIGIAFKDVTGDPVINKDDETGMTFLGFLLLEDPVKTDASAIIKQLKDIGVSLKIITGDNRLAAAHLAAQIEISTKYLLTGDEIDQLNDQALTHRIKDADIFAEIEPQQKERIVRLLRSSGHVVAYLGDGINDAPALKAADVGISVDGATDVAKEAADIVMLEKNLEVLYTSIITGRKTFQNTLKYIFITTSANFGNMFSLAGISLFLPWLPLLPAQILTLNFLSDIPAFFVTSDHVDPEQLMRQKRWDINLIRRFMIVFGIQSSLFDYFTFGILFFVFKANETTFQTGWFVLSVLTELAVLLIIRTARPVFNSRPAPWLLWASIGIAFVAILLPYTPVSKVIGLQPLPPTLLVAVIGLAGLYGVVVEIMKRRFFAKLDM